MNLLDHDILRYLSSLPEDLRYPHELARRLRQDTSIVLTALNEMHRDGLVRSHPLGNWSIVPYQSAPTLHAPPRSTFP